MVAQRHNQQPQGPQNKIGDGGKSRARGPVQYRVVNEAWPIHQRRRSAIKTHARNTGNSTGSATTKTAGSMIFASCTTMALVRMRLTDNAAPSSLGDRIGERSPRVVLSGRWRAGGLLRRLRLPADAKPIANTSGSGCHDLV